MIKCGVCGSENEAAALFCGTCGSPLNPVEAKEIVDDATKVNIAATPEPDESVVPGKGGARRDLGIGGGTQAIPDGQPKAEPEVIADQETMSGGPTITCGVCGTVNDATRTYCRKCANELKPAAPPPPPPPPAAAARRISPLAIGLGAAAVVVAIALIGVLVLGGGKSGASLGPSAKASASPGASIPSAGPTAAASPAPTATARTFTEGALKGQIAFAHCTGANKECAIYLRPADKSSKARRIVGATGASALDPSISHDGKKILYVVEPGLWVVTISTRTFVQHSTSPGDTNPDWAPGDQSLTFAGHRSRDNAGNDLEIRTDGIKSTASSVSLTNNDEVDHDPVYTPDGKSIIFVQGEGDTRELKMINIASGDITDLTTDSFADEDPAVSPDGTEVAFASKRGDGTEFDLFVLDLATMAITPLPTRAGNEHDPSWSPGGRYIVFSGGPDGDKNLFILDRANDKVSTFTTGVGNDIEPFWR